MRHLEVEDVACLRASTSLRRALIGLGGLTKSTIAMELLGLPKAPYLRDSERQ